MSTRRTTLLHNNSLVLDLVYNNSLVLDIVHDPSHVNNRPLIFEHFPERVLMDPKQLKQGPKLEKSSKQGPNWRKVVNKVQTREK